MWGSRTPHSMCVWYMCAQCLCRSSSACCRQRTCWIHSSSSGIPAQSGPTTSLSSIGAWPSEQMFLHTRHMCSLYLLLDRLCTMYLEPSLELSILLLLFCSQPVLVLPCSGLCAVFQSSLFQDFPIHGERGRGLPLLTLPALLPHWISAKKKTRYRIRKVTKITLTGGSD